MQNSEGILQKKINEKYLKVNNVIAGLNFLFIKKFLWQSLTRTESPFNYQERREKQKLYILFLMWPTEWNRIIF